MSYLKIIKSKKKSTRQQTLFFFLNIKYTETRREREREKESEGEINESKYIYFLFQTSFYSKRREDVYIMKRTLLLFIDRNTFRQDRKLQHRVYTGTVLGARFIFRNGMR